MKRLLIPVILLVAVGLGSLLLPAAEEGADGAALTLYGTVDIREVALAFRQPGRLATVVVEEGDEVEAGALVATLDDEPLRQALAAAAARVDVAGDRASRLERGTRPQEIGQAEATVGEAAARLVAAQSEFERKNGLLTAGASSEREVEAARADYDAAAARLAAAREGLNLAKEGFRKEDVASGRSELRLAEAQLEQARTALADAQLLAPSSGTVVQRVREPGSMVAVGSPIVTLSLHHPVVVRAYVPEPQLGVVPPGTAVEVTTDSSSKVYRGRVGFVSPRAEFTPKTVETPELRTDLVYRLRIVIEDADQALRQGMPVTVGLRPGTSS